MDKDIVALSPTKRFSNRVDNYVKYRPSYPAAMLSFFESTLGLKKEQRIADIGSGTGLFAKPLLQQGYSVVCIEPNEDMRKAGEQQLGSYPGFTSRKHTAEQTGLPYRTGMEPAAARVALYESPSCAQGKIPHRSYPGAQ